MKNKSYFILVVILFSSYACNDQSIKTVNKTKQENKKAEAKPISLLDKGFFKAIFLPGGDKLITSSENDKGLALYDSKNDVLEQLNSKEGAGMYPKITSNGKYVVYQTHQFKNRRRMTSLYIQDVEEKTIIPIIEDKRSIKLLNVENSKVFFLEDETVKVFDILVGETSINPKGVELAFTDNNLNLSFYSNGEKKNINPMGKGNYLWVSLSPNKDKVLYNFSGKGTYIENVIDKSKTDLGRLHAAKWSKDGNWIIGMDDYDDGHKYTKSDILMVSVDGKVKKNLTENSDVIALYPSISSNNDKIIYNNEEGRVYLMKLK